MQIYACFLFHKTFRHRSILFFFAAAAIAADAAAHTAYTRALFNIQTNIYIRYDYFTRIYYSDVSMAKPIFIYVKQT